MEKSKSGFWDSGVEGEVLGGEVDVECGEGLGKKMHYAYKISRRSGEWE